MRPVSGFLIVLDDFFSISSRKLRWILRGGKPLFQGIPPFLAVIAKLLEQILGALRLLLDGFLDHRTQVFLAFEDDAEKRIYSLKQRLAIA